MQLRMARLALKWRVDDLSKKSDVSWARIQNMERSDDVIINEQIKKIIDVFHENNVIFFEEEKNFLPYIKVKKK